MYRLIAEPSMSSASQPFQGRWSVLEDGWIVIHVRRIESRDLNAYGTLFGGVLLGEVVASAERFLQTEAPGTQVWRLSDFLFERAALPGETLRFLLRPGEVRDGQLSVCVRVVTLSSDGEDGPHSIGTCLLGVGTTQGASKGPDPSYSSALDGPLPELAELLPAPLPTDFDQEWHFVQSRWVIRGECHPNGLFQTQALLALLDETAVSFCRDQGRVGRFVTRRVSSFQLSHALHLDDTLKLYFRVQEAGRSSLTVTGAIVRTFSRERGCVFERVGEATFIMVATDAQGRPTRHALSRVSAEPALALVNRPSSPRPHALPSLAPLAQVRLSALSDQQELRRFFASLSERSLRQRYLGTFQHDFHKIEALAVAACNLQPHREQTLVITVPDPTTGAQVIVGVGQLHLAVLEPEAEISLLVADAYQGRGLGARLVSALITRTRSLSYERLEASFFRENLPMRRLLERNGFRMKTSPGESVLNASLTLMAEGSY